MHKKYFTQSNIVRYIYVFSCICFIYLHYIKLVTRAFMQNAILLYGSIEKEKRIPSSTLDTPYFHAILN